MYQKIFLLKTVDSGIRKKILRCRSTNLVSQSALSIFKPISCSYYITQMAILCAKFRSLKRLIVYNNSLIVRLQLIRLYHTRPLISLFIIFLCIGIHLVIYIPEKEHLIYFKSPYAFLTQHLPSFFKLQPPNKIFQYASSNFVPFFFWNRNIL